MSGSPNLPLEVQREPDAITDREEVKSIATSSSDVVSLWEESLQLSKREVVAGTVRVSTQTETYDGVAEVALDHGAVDVTRVPVGQVIDVAPEVCTDGDTTIIPVVEERFVIVKQLYLIEELHIRRHLRREVSQVTVPLRRQTAVVERLDARGVAGHEPSRASVSDNGDPASK